MIPAWRYFLFFIKGTVHISSCDLTVALAIACNAIQIYVQSKDILKLVYNITCHILYLFQLARTVKRPRGHVRVHEDKVGDTKIYQLAVGLRLG